MAWRPSLHLGVVAIEKGAFGLPSTKVAFFTYLYSRNHTLLLIIFTQKIIFNSKKKVNYVTIHGQVVNDTEDMS